MRGVDIIAPRQSGKTTALVGMSAALQQPIVCATVHRARLITERALSLGLDIPDPIPVAGIVHRIRSHGFKGCLVDDLDAVLATLLGLPITSYTLTPRRRS